jgi:acid phosphatase
MNNFALLAMCGALSYAQTHENLNALVWVQRSAEYRALTTQTYQAARTALDRALKDKKSTAATEQEQVDKKALKKMPPAIILDLDETVLDNSTYQVELLRQNAAFSDASWQAWVARVEAKPLAGAKEFLDYADSKKVAIFYVTNRVCDAADLNDPTVTVLRRRQMPLVSERLLCKKETSNKSPRRAAVAAEHRVLLLLGDDLNDFVTADAAAGGAGRDTLAEAHRERWGRQWFLLPNPMYGSWERAIGFEVQKKRDALRP